MSKYEEDLKRDWGPTGWKAQLLLLLAGAAMLGAGLLAVGVNNQNSTPMPTTKTSVTPTTTPTP